MIYEYQEGLSKYLAIFLLLKTLNFWLQKIRKSSQIKRSMCAMTTYLTNIPTICGVARMTELSWHGMGTCLHWGFEAVQNPHKMQKIF